jgi:hypothetical protein
MDVRPVLPGELFSKGMKTVVRNMGSFIEVNHPLVDLRKY